MSWGVRGRITVVATVVVLIVLVATGAAVLAAQRYVLTESVDEGLLQASDAIARNIDSDDLSRVLGGQGDDEAFARVVDSNGRVLTATPREVDIPPVAPEEARPHMQTVRLSSGVEYRVFSERHGDVVIEVGTPLDDVEESVAALALNLSIAIPVAAALLALLVWLIVGRVLRPVEDVRRQVAEITASSLDRRVPEPNTRDEIARLARTMNEMLARLEAASVRQQRFVADASHELRSPLTRIRTELEVDLAHPESADLAATHRTVLTEADTLQRLVDDLLTLARSDSTTSVGRREPVDLDDIVLDEVRRLQAAALVAVDVSGVSAAQVAGDPLQLARVIRNLLDNAVQHGGRNLIVQLRDEQDGVVLSIADDGTGIPVELHERVFERFARVDEARGAIHGGSGLGLAIARDVVTAHGGTVTVDGAHSPGARFIVRLPRTD